MEEKEIKIKVGTKVEAVRSSVGIVGCGLVGRSWAIVFGRAGYHVKLFDTLPGATDKALVSIQKLCEQLESNDLLGGRTTQQVLACLEICSEVAEVVTGVEWCQECTPEELEQKKKVFQQLDSLAAPEVILASSSSALPASAFTSGLLHPSRCLVAHPVNPPHLVPLVEVVPSPTTAASVVVHAQRLLAAVGQVPIVVKKEVESFVLNRLQGALLNESWKLVQEGYISAEDLDRTVRDGLGLRWAFMGPFETIDLNAPGGVRDYVTRYSENMYSLAQQQAKACKWEGAVIDQVEAERRAVLPLDQLPTRAQWRDSRLMALISLKKRLAQQEQEEEERESKK